MKQQKQIPCKIFQKTKTQTNSLYGSIFLTWTTLYYSNNDLFIFDTTIKDYFIKMQTSEIEHPSDVVNLDNPHKYNWKWYVLRTNKNWINKRLKWNHFFSVVVVDCFSCIDDACDWHILASEMCFSISDNVSFKQPSSAKSDEWVFYSNLRFANDAALNVSHCRWNLKTKQNRIKKQREIWWWRKKHIAK